ncbi:MAG: PEP-CTERM sorting domain-containing protein [Okeania sp. SIO3C4]|nr:PEP-CTERM sorting domain-containing protein [Okeania sp. SIO3C4]
MNSKTKNTAFEKLKLAPIAIAAATTGMMLAAAPGQAVVTDLDITVTQGGVEYTDIDNSTVDLEGVPSATGDDAYGISEANLTDAGMDDSFDDFGGIFVNGAAFNQPNDEVDLTTTGAGTFVNTISPVNLGGIDTSLDYFMDASSPTLRVFGTFTNTTANPFSATIAYGGNLGCDSDCTLNDSSTGDTTFESELDRWFIVSDEDDIANDDPEDPVLTFVRFGPGGQVASSTPFFPGDGDEDDDLTDIWNLSLAPGETQSLMWFVNFNETIAAAQAGTSVFDNLTTLGDAGLLDGLSQTQIDQTANWVPEQQPPIATTPEPSSLLGLGSFLGLGLLSKVKRKKK